MRFSELSPKENPDLKEMEATLKCLHPTILAIIFWQFAVFPLKFDSPQVKQNLISSIIKVLYELSHKLQNDLKLRVLANIRKTLTLSGNTD